MSGKDGNDVKRYQEKNFIDKNCHFKSVFIDFISEGNLELVGFTLDERDRIKQILKEAIKNDDISIRNSAFKCLVKLQDSWAITELRNDYYRENYVYLVIDLLLHGLCQKIEDECDRYIKYNDRLKP